MERPYILYVGDRRMGYKNFVFLLYAIVPILTEIDNLQLLCIGDPFTQQECDIINNLGLSDKILQKFASDTEMFSIYKNARLFIYPSYYEGFGIPIVEAFQANCPVIVADTNVFREVAGDAALYFSPKSCSDLQKQVRLLLNSPRVKNSLIEKANVRNTEFSWQESAEKTANVYKQIIENE